MSTAELYLTQEEIEEFIAETHDHYREHEMYSYGYEGALYGVCPFITFYIYHRKEDFLPLCHEAIELHQELQTLIDAPYQRVYNDRTENFVKATPEKLGSDLLREHAQLDAKAGKDFLVGATDQESRGSSANWAISAWITRYRWEYITFCDRWYRQNESVWHRFVEKWLNRLQPEQCYSGYEIGTTTTGPMGAYESDVMERICANYFYGLDIDHPQKMGYHRHDNEDGRIDYAALGAGLRTPTWSFLLSPLWRGKLGKSIGEVKAASRHPDILVTEIPYPRGKHNPNGEPALWIQLGELNLYPVDEGVPELPVLANRLIRPIRCNLLQLYALDPWEDDPNPRFDEENRPRWMARFDEDSDWPNKESRQKPPPPKEAELPVSLQCEAGRPCPRSGYWRTPARPKSRRKFNQGEILPEVESVTHGTIVWHWDANQG
ncbi:MAG: DUF3396 domain-containing protein [Zoogloeaceae bacterium]|jgi:hypothetical protein|nr:DUF3396 domain-containing protein [Zoogloeaceae bacterium]